MHNSNLSGPANSLLLNIFHLKNIYNIKVAVPNDGPIIKKLNEIELIMKYFYQDIGFYQRSYLI